MDKQKRIEGVQLFHKTKLTKKGKNIDKIWGIIQQNSLSH
jgi:hypothetical protein